MAYDKTKTNGQLGEEIHQKLVSLGIETPTTAILTTLSNKEKIDKIESLMTEVWKTLGIDLSDDSLMETPKRIAKSLVLDTHWGLLPENFPKNTTIMNKIRCDEMVTVTGIPVMSSCEHHGVIFTGSAVVAYVPDQKVIGLSKLARVVEYFSRRPQVQERLTSQIYYSLSHILETEHVAVSIRAQHYCMISRGVEAHNAWTHTTKLGGSFKDKSETRAEFLSKCEN